MEHYYTASPTGERRDFTITARCLSQDFTFRSSTGVFSKSHIDTGTALLAETVAREEAQAGPARLLDLGCGYGPIGVILAKVHPHLEILMADINERAVDLAQANIAANGVAANAAAIRSDGFSAVGGGHFDIIVTNPPLRTGKQAVTSMFEASRDRLKPGGRFYAVVMRKQGAESYQAILARIFGNCEAVEKGSGFWVLRSVN